MEPWRFSDRLLDRLAGGGPLVVLSGAGISAESGLATFRGPGGLWEGRDPQELATPEAFERDPQTVWRFYDWRRRQARRAEPNPAHTALAALERARGALRIVTQNVDGLHERAGSREVLRLHGTLWRLRCVAEGLEHDDEREDLGTLPPRCACGALLRPAVVWFGEPLPDGVFAEAMGAARRAALLLVVGTSSRVHPAASLAPACREAGGWLVEINPERTPLSSSADEWIGGPAGRVLPELFAAAGYQV